MQEVHFPEHFLILWWIDVQPWSLSNAVPHLQKKKYLISWKTPGNEGDSPRNCSPLEPREFLCFCAKCGTQIFGFAFTRSHTAAGFIIFVLKERERLCPPKSPCNNNSSGQKKPKKRVLWYTESLMAARTSADHHQDQTKGYLDILF